MGNYNDLMKLNEKPVVPSPQQTPPIEAAKSPILQKKPAKVTTTKRPSNTTEHSSLESNSAQRVPRARLKESKIDSMLSRNHASKQASYQANLIELLRKTVKFAGKEPFFGRFTPEEKTMLADIAYTYKRNGMRTSENEIVRIAVNFIIEDYNQNGENSLLDKVLRALNT